VLRMAPLAEGDFLDAVAARGGLTPALLDALGDSVAQYHARLPPIAGWDSPGTLLRIGEGSRASALVAGLPRATIERWFEQAASALRACAASLAARAAAGFVRRGHGDLHLGNLCLWDGKPTPFDALEFDEALATADLGYDLAFLLMDLDRRVGREAANRVLNRYVARTGDAALTCGLPAFLSLRAMIRAHVQAEAGRPTEGAAYLDAALAYLHRKPALLLAIGGLQGTGKSTQARMLAPGIGDAPGALVLRSDEIRKRLFGVAPEQRLPETAYAEAVNEAVNRELVRLAQAVAACGHAVVADASFLDPGLRAAIAAAANAARVPFIGVLLHAPLDVLEERLAARTHDASDATADVLRRAAACDPGPINWLPVEASDAIRAASSIRRELLGGIAGRSCPQDW
jgi:predicted kinase